MGLGGIDDSIRGAFGGLTLYVCIFLALAWTEDRYSDEPYLDWDRTGQDSEMLNENSIAYILLYLNPAKFLVRVRD